MGRDLRPERSGHHVGVRRNPADEGQPSTRGGNPDSVDPCHGLARQGYGRGSQSVPSPYVGTFYPTDRRETSGPSYFGRGAWCDSFRENHRDQSSGMPSEHLSPQAAGRELLGRCGLVHLPAGAERVGQNHGIMDAGSRPLPQRPAPDCRDGKAAGPRFPPMV